MNVLRSVDLILDLDTRILTISSEAYIIISWAKDQLRGNLTNRNDKADIAKCSANKLVCDHILDTPWGPLSNISG